MTIGTYTAAPGDAAPRALPFAIAFMGCLALAARPSLMFIGFGVTLSVGAAGALAPSRGEKETSAAVTCAVTLLGIAAFASVRAVAAVPPMPATLATGFMAIGAAAAEELFFRRFLYGALAGWGATIAVVVSAVAFALVHIPAYGTAVFPIDLAAGFVLSWQRWATGSWVSPGVSHAAANLMAIL
jgi:membrane protease YdiL (CAAX protease family)